MHACNEGRKMLINTPAARVQLRPGQTARFELTPLARLRGVRGQAWITVDNDPRDIVLGPGDEFVAHHAGHAMASALRGVEPAELLVTA